MTLVFALFVLLGIAPAVVFGQLRLSQCTFTVGNQQTNAQAFYHCANDFVSYDALNLPFTSLTACVWNNQQYSTNAGYNDIHLNSASYPNGYIHVTFVPQAPQKTFHCYSSDNKCMMNGYSDSECFDAKQEVKKLFSNVCNRFFVECEKPRLAEEAL